MYLVKSIKKLRFSENGHDPRKMTLLVRAAFTTPFSRPPEAPGRSLRPRFIFFSVPQGSTFAWNRNSFEICILKPQNWENQFSSPQMWSNQFYEPQIGQTIGSKRPQIWWQSVLLSPYFRPFGPHTHTKLKVEYGGGGTGVKMVVFKARYLSFLVRIDSIYQWIGNLWNFNIGPVFSWIEEWVFHLVIKKDKAFPLFFPKFCCFEW